MAVPMSRLMNELCREPLVPIMEDFVGRWSTWIGDRLAPSSLITFSLLARHLFCNNSIEQEVEEKKKNCSGLTRTDLVPDAAPTVCGFFAHTSWSMREERMNEEGNKSLPAIREEFREGEFRPQASQSDRNIIIMFFIVKSEKIHINSSLTQTHFAWLFLFLNIFKGMLGNAPNIRTLLFARCVVCLPHGLLHSQGQMPLLTVEKIEAEDYIGFDRTKARRVSRWF